MFIFSLIKPCNEIESSGLMQEKNKPRYAHRTILAAASPYFNAMFTSDFVEAVDAKRQQVCQNHTNIFNIQYQISIIL